MNPLQALKGKSIQKFVTKDSKFGELEWEIKPIPFTLLLEHFDKFSSLPTEKDLKDGNLPQEVQDKLQASIYPMMQAILPRCIVTPKVTFDEEVAKKDDYIHLDDIPYDSLMELFNKIVELTGLNKEGEDARKNLPKTTSPSA